MSVDLKALAHLGAQARLAELVAETDALLRAFPDLANAGTKQGTVPTAGAPARAKRARRKKYHMTAEQRAAVSARMKVYWAARRKAKSR
jgi:hypothetical protein